MMLSFSVHQRALDCFEYSNLLGNGGFNLSCPVAFFLIFVDLNPVSQVQLTSPPSMKPKLVVIPPGSNKGIRNIIQESKKSASSTPLKNAGSERIHVSSSPCKIVHISQHNIHATSNSVNAHLPFPSLLVVYRWAESSSLLCMILRNCGRSSSRSKERFPLLPEGLRLFHTISPGQLAAGKSNDEVSILIACLILCPFPLSMCVQYPFRDED